MQQRYFIHIEATMFPDDWTLNKMAVYSLIYSLSTEASQCVLNLDWFATMCRCTKRTIQNILAEFEELQLVEISRVPGKQSYIRVINEPMQAVVKEKPAQETVDKTTPPPTPQKIMGEEHCQTIHELDLLKKWLRYKIARRESYKDAESIRLFLNKLRKYGNNDPATMTAVIEQSMANNWAGIFELKQGQNNSKSTALDEMFRGQKMAEEILKRRGII